MMYSERHTGFGESKKMSARLIASKFFVSVITPSVQMSAVSVISPSDIDALADYVVMMKDGQKKEFNMQKQKINLEEVYMKFYD